ncbi:hypothetical protein B0H34DRAFT_707395 [Crassisporium funariophilum]|nr:hypothetical protein B0H34DRAFT_707395 [Crassisporium funariophilum]
MSARLARTTLASVGRRAQTTASSTARVFRRTMASTSHGAPAKSSDKPWIFGSLLVFGPALLYLISPSARKNTHAVHNDQRDFPALKLHDEHYAPTNKNIPPAAAKEETMTDDEGTEANVGSSIALSEQADVPNDSQSPDVNAATKAAAETDDTSRRGVAVTDNAPPSEDTTAKAKGPEDKDQQKTDEKGQKSGTYQKDGEEGPTEMSKAKDAAQACCYALVRRLSC